MSGEGFKAAYDDFAVDVAASFGTVYVRAGAVLEAAKGVAPEGVRGLREALEFAAQDIEDRVAALERRLNEFRPSDGPEVRGLRF